MYGSLCLVKQIKHSWCQYRDVGDTHALIVGDLDKCLQSGVTSHVILESVIIYLDHIAQLLFIQVLVAHRDELSHGNYRALLNLLVNVCLL
jgi:hypothetical protein